MTDEMIRLSKLMTEQGLCSRREADSYIEKGWVLVNGDVIDRLGTRVSPNAEISLLPPAQKKQESKVTILLHKPLGIVSAQAEDGYTPAIALITPENQDPDFPGPNLEQRHLKNLAVAGRLDINSKGLLVFTQDGRVAKRLIGENSPVKKEYLVRIGHKAERGQLERLRHGLEMDGKQLKPAEVIQLNDEQLLVVLQEGRKRQIRRMCEQVDLDVLALKRVRTGKVKLGTLKEGCWRWLQEGEEF
jgi:23S rRNA pseudouridine2604 synthase